MDGEGTVEERYKGLPSLSALFCCSPLSPYPERNATKVSDAGRSERGSEGGRATALFVSRSPTKRERGHAQITSASDYITQRVGEK